jgi:hypothetical protein
MLRLHIVAELAGQNGRFATMFIRTLVIGLKVNMNKTVEL